MFWFWFMFVIHLLMIVLDAVWWVVAMRLMKREAVADPGECLSGGAVGRPFFAHVRFDWRHYTPESRARGGRYLALSEAGLRICRSSTARNRARLRVDGPGMARVTGVRRNRPVAAPASANSVTRREFIGACAALAPPLFTVGLTGVALAQLNQFPRAALYAFDSGAAQGAGRNHHRARERYPCGPVDMRPGVAGDGQHDQRTPGRSGADDRRPDSTTNWPTFPRELTW